MCSPNLKQLSLWWDDFSVHWRSVFKDIFESEDFVDVTLATDGHFIQAHKVVLSACSTYFKLLFKVY